MPGVPGGPSGPVGPGSWEGREVEGGLVDVAGTIGEKKEAPLRSSCPVLVPRVDMRDGQSRPPRLIHVAAFHPTSNIVSFNLGL